jgi:Family of unknown function (DUF5908)
MPIEIKELVVKAILVEDGNRQGGNTNDSTSASAQLPNVFDDASRQKLLEDCVQQVLAILERQKDR